MELGRVKSRERAILFRSLEVLFASGISLPRSLLILANQFENPRLAQALERISQRLLTGSSFSHAVKEFPFLFSDQCRRTLEVAESAGALPQVMKRLSEHEEKSFETVLVLRQALIYPAWVLVLSLVFVFWVPPVLFGELFGLLERSGQELPLLTKAVITVSKIGSHPLALLAFPVFLFLVGSAMLQIYNKPKGRLRIYQLLHANPFASRQLTALATCRFARSLALLHQVGVPISQALRLAGNASGDPVLKRRMRVAVDSLDRGAILESALADTEYFPSSFLSTVALGQESGSLSEVLTKIVALYELELEHRARSITAALEPIAILLMGILVGVFILATMMPLMQLLQGL